MKIPPKTKASQHFKHPKAHCPHCGHVLTMSSDASSWHPPTSQNPSPWRPPEKGDLSICYYCLQPLRFVGTVKRPKFAKVDPAKLHPLNQHQLEHIISKVKQYKAEQSLSE
jgi:hypothetical protein